MNPGETLNNAVIRPVKEEIGSIINGCFGNSDVNGDAGAEFIISNSYTKKAEERVSDGLPDGEFLRKKSRSKKILTRRSLRMVPFHVKSIRCILIRSFCGL